MSKQLSRADIVNIVKRHFEKGQVVNVSRSILAALEIYRDHKKSATVYKPLTERQVDRVILGQYYKFNKRQRRKLYYQHPPLRRGRPSTLQADIFLISRLAYVYAKHTGKKPTFRGNGNHHEAPFEDFATYVMIAEGVYEPRLVYREYSRLRKYFPEYPLK